MKKSMKKKSFKKKDKDYSEIDKIQAIDKIYGKYLKAMNELSIERKKAFEKFVNKIKNNRLKQVRSKLNK